MTENIEHRIMSLEHMMKQPADKRYALYCRDAFRKPSQTDCDAKGTMGYIGDFEEYASAREVALSHLRDAIIRFYPSSENPEPSQDFITFKSEQSIDL